MARLSAQASGVTIKLFGAASKARWPMLQSSPVQLRWPGRLPDADWPDQVRRFTDGAGIQYAYDAISEGDSVKKVASLLDPNGHMAIVRSRAGGAWKAEELPTEPIYGAVWEGLGEEVQYHGMTVPKSAAAREFAVRFYHWLSSALGSELQPVPIRLMLGGLSSIVEDGFALLGGGGMEDRAVSREEEWMRPVSAQKLVYQI